MQDAWAERPNHYLSLAAGHNFPNWFIIGGPNSAVGSGSLLVLYERVVDYIVEVIKKVQREEIKAIAVKDDAVRDYMEYVDAYFPKTVYSEKCRSWYKAGRELGPVFALWPGQSSRFLAQCNSADVHLQAPVFMPSRRSRTFDGKTTITCH